MKKGGFIIPVVVGIVILVLVGTLIYFFTGDDEVITETQEVAKELDDR